ncbi:cysteine proteinase [Fragilariopsis cylindrus CCMP1102]|uniref:Cysteine proteinase n=1 Tax=Fragilariopsis cylindrus CCMP1102 TaxID=635003 RepID=A0A1E7ES10_9STRA|nr:cysteine proteinase [Fragilariopsis cylindrus CCMP1102]|eukprot:OEU08810.1 cysteine proteinase [Fragilariopsis cylindrus CCMP1102]
MDIEVEEVEEEEEISTKECDDSTPDVNDDNNMNKSQCNAKMARSKSFSEFMFSDIENLLYEDSNKSSRRLSATALTSLDRGGGEEDESPKKYKLAGGRMSTIGIELTPYIDEEDNDDDENFNVTDTTNLDNKNNLYQIPGVDDTDIEMQLMKDKQEEEEEDDSDDDDESSRSPTSSFTTEVRVCLTCESCKFRRSHVETYLHLSIEIGSECLSIEDGLRKFIVDVSPDYTSISYRKDQSDVSFEERMELEHVDDNDDTDDEEGRIQDFLSLDAVTFPKGAAYEIRSVVNHIGSSASCGHYTGDAKKEYNDNGNDDSIDNKLDNCCSDDHVDNDDDNRNNEEREKDQHQQQRQWTRFNDTYVSKISSREAVHDTSQTAYMIMYELVV